MFFLFQSLLSLSITDKEFVIAWKNDKNLHITMNDNNITLKKMEMPLTSDDENVARFEPNGHHFNLKFENHVCYKDKELYSCDLTGDHGQWYVVIKRMGVHIVNPNGHCIKKEGNNVILDKCQDTEDFYWHLLTVEDTITNSFSNYYSSKLYKNVTLGTDYNKTFKESLLNHQDNELNPFAPKKVTRLI